MTSEWKGKWALVTGASAGIGKALAEELAAGGTHLILTARRRDRLDELGTRLRAKCKIQAEIFEADLTKPSARKKSSTSPGKKELPSTSSSTTPASANSAS